MLHVNRVHVCYFFACVVVISLLLGVLDASWMATKVVTAALSIAAPFLLLRHRDDSIDPPLDVLAWRVGFRARKLPQLMESASAKRR